MRNSENQPVLSGKSKHHLSIWGLLKSSQGLFQAQDWDFFKKLASTGAIHLQAISNDVMKKEDTLLPMNLRMRSIPKIGQAKDVSLRWNPQTRFGAHLEKMGFDPVLSYWDSDLSFVMEQMR